MTRELQFLVVDDEPTSRLELKEILSNYGKVDEAESGVEAVSVFREALLEKTPYHLVTLDVSMPTLDGLVTLECIRGLEMVHHSLPKTKILMVTGTARQDVIIGSIRLGSEGCLVKPLDRTLIEAKVREMFRMPLFSEHKPNWLPDPNVARLRPSANIRSRIPRRCRISAKDRFIPVI